jgi:hypothetical protein
MAKALTCAMKIQQHSEYPGKNGRTMSGIKAPYYIELLENPAELYGLYDNAVHELIEVIQAEGYFDSWRGDVTWPDGSRDTGAVSLDELRVRATVSDAVYRGLPSRRDARLDDAYQQFKSTLPAYYEGNRAYIRLKALFIECGAGDEKDFLRLYQELYVEALSKTELMSPDEGEEALSAMRLARIPLSHARSVAETLVGEELDDPEWERVYTCEIDGTEVNATLRDLLRDVVERTIQAIATGELLATRYNTYSNFGLLGTSFWKTFVDADLLLGQLADRSDADTSAMTELADDVRTAHAMFLEFLRAHTEDPSKLKPTGYWYGQVYSYLTRDMIDLTVRIVERADAIVKHLDPSTDRPASLEMPPLMSEQLRGRFLEYGHVGRTGEFSKLTRVIRFARWIVACWRFGRGKIKIDAQVKDAPAKRLAAWNGSLKWSERTLSSFDIKVSVSIDPRFHEIAREMELESGNKKILFFPTHQSLHDHPVMYEVLRSPELLGAMGWEQPEPCAILARTGLARAGVRVGKLDITMFGTSSENFDRLLDEVDNYITLERAAANRHTTNMIADALEDRPGLVYPMATTAAFAGQVFPPQHALFAMLPEDMVVIPVALRGIHSLWPKCPKGNFQINPGVVEAVVMPPLLGETTLLPKRRSLRIQYETAAFFQSLHIVSLLNPELSEQTPLAQR